MSEPDPSAPLGPIAWIALVARWTQLASVTRGRLGDDQLATAPLRDSVAPLIAIEATTAALGELARVPSAQRAQARDMAEFTIDDATNTLDALWGDQAFPQEIDDALEAAHRALWRALYCELEELVVTGEGAFEVPDLLLGFQEDLAASHHGTLAAMAPGSLAFPGEPIAWWCERNAPSFTSPRLTRRAAGGPTQVLRFVDASSRFVADRVIALDALAEPLPIDALPMLTPLLLNGARIGVFLHARSEWSAMQHDAMQGRSALTVER